MTAMWPLLLVAVSGIREDGRQAMLEVGLGRLVNGSNHTNHTETNHSANGSVGSFTKAVENSKDIDQKAQYNADNMFLREKTHI